jgi:hypothetical protein
MLGVRNGQWAFPSVQDAGENARWWISGWPNRLERYCEPVIRLSNAHHGISQWLVRFRLRSV